MKIRKLAEMIILLLSCVPAAGIAADPSAPYPVPLTGFDLQNHYRSETWQVSVQHRDGFHTRARFYPNGSILGVNFAGGGSINGRWQVDAEKDQLCLHLDQVGVGNGCFHAVQIGPASFEFRDAPSGRWLWRMEMLNF